MASNRYHGNEHSPSPTHVTTSLSDSLPPVFSQDQPKEYTTTSHVQTNNSDSAPSPQPVTRKLCVRHQRMADEGTSLNLQQV